MNTNTGLCFQVIGSQLITGNAITPDAGWRNTVIVSFDTTDLNFGGPLILGTNFWAGGDGSGVELLKRVPKNPNDRRHHRAQSDKIEAWGMRPKGKLIIVDRNNGIRVFFAENPARPVLYVPEALEIATYLWEYARRATTHRALEWVRHNLEAVFTTDRQNAKISEYRDQVKSMRASDSPP